MATEPLFLPRPRQPTLHELIARATEARTASLQLRDEAEALRRHAAALRELDDSAARREREPRP